MASNNNAAQREQETQLLRFLCDADAELSPRHSVIQALAGRRWSDPDHTILFECICALFARSPRQILAHLPAALTRRGFPDISCDALRGPCGLGPDEALTLARSLPR